MSAAAAAGAGAGAVNETSPAADLDGVDTIKLYLQEEGFSALSRIRSKILSTGEATQSLACGVLVGLQGVLTSLLFLLVPVQLV